MVKFQYALVWSKSVYVIVCEMLGCVIIVMLVKKGLQVYLEEKWKIFRIQLQGVGLKSPIRNMGFYEVFITQGLGLSN